MAHYRTRHRVQIVKLDREITVVTEFDRRGNPKKYETIPANSALIAEGEGEDQEIKWMAWDDAMQRYEPEEEIGAHADEPSRAAARRYQDDPRRDGWREPRHSDSPYPRRDDTYLAPPPPPQQHVPAMEPYRMPTLLPPVAVPPVDDEQAKRAERL